MMEIEIEYDVDSASHLYIVLQPLNAVFEVAAPSSRRKTQLVMYHEGQSLR